MPRGECLFGSVCCTLFCLEWLFSILRVCQNDQHADDNVCKILIGNKVDREAERVRCRKKLLSASPQHPCTFPNQEYRKIDDISTSNDFPTMSVRRK